MIKIISIIITNHHTESACRNVEIEFIILEKTTRIRARCIMINKIFTDDTFSAFRIILFTNFRKQQQPNIIKSESSNRHYVSGLYELFTGCCINVEYSGSLSVFMKNPRDSGVCSSFKIISIKSSTYDSCIRTCSRPPLTGIESTESVVLTRI